ncbi:MAG: plasma-membrane proton-efflux P-type ATPase [Gemmatimonadales bacterium]
MTETAAIDDARPHGDGAVPDSSALETDLTSGLASTEARRRLVKWGPNALEEKRTRPLAKLLSYFWGPIPWMIEVAAVLSIVVHHWVDLTIILVMLLVNAVVGFWQEFKADNAINALRQRLALKARVLRDGEWRELSAAELVPGDVIKVKLGNIVPADARLVDGTYLSVDQSALTGESLPVEKAVGDTVYSGSITHQGEAKAVVAATGMNTYFGKTAKLVQSAGKTSHFQHAVLGIGNFLILTTLLLAAIILLVALFRDDPLLQTVQFVLILTVAAIPVALPAVLSVTLAVGAERLARMKAIVSRLVAIEEMAGVDMLCADKTGTLTQNRLTVSDPATLNSSSENELLLIAALASESSNDDPIDRAILTAVTDRDHLESYEVVDFTPFDPVRKRTEATVQQGTESFHVSKGAPQVILDLVQPSHDVRQRVTTLIEEFASKGYRALGVARTDREGRWTYLGLLPLSDPPREDTAETIDAAKQRGITIKMVTGDHASIAKRIAAQLHLSQRILPADEVFHDDMSARELAELERADGFAQVFPEHKYDIVRALQANGHIVGMTGDGVNDAPALKQADVGIAVSGATDAARAAADLVLTAPGLSVVARAVDEARRIFARMITYATYRIAETVRVLLFMTLSILVFDFYPVTAVMIILLAMLNDFPIMMVAYDNAPLERHPVRWRMPRVLSIAVLLGLLGVVSSFGMFWIAWGYLRLPADTVQTLVFLKLLVAGHLTIYLTRNEGPIWQRPLPSAKLLVTTEATQVVGTLAAVYGWFVTPIGWHYAIMVWVYALLWFGFNSLVKIMAYRLLDRTAHPQAQHLARLHTSLHAAH